MNSFKVAKEKRKKTWPFIKSADKLSFLDDKVDIKHNIVDLIGESIYSAYEGKSPKLDTMLDKARFKVDIDLEKDYGISFDYKKDDYKLTFTKGIF